ncbi:regulatory protein [Streptomyces sp. 150FB]|uniref:ATP-binding protein n=1 Tax=Streptomyces sp. 150FB TaxID=1576605 RepID=UPI000589114B|nr:ATP-binding protein [Streptomyces sp. 150FB]KIF76514.1 regulatory protein [Streptomyces sp. 150FB]
MVGLIGTEGACAEWIFPAEPGAVRSARHAVHEALQTWNVPPAVSDVAVLLVSELVTNSCLYALGPIGVRLSLPDPDVLLVEVSDPVPDAPVARAVGPEDEGGRGLQLVAGSARRWGTRRGKTGKTVWFELPLLG